MFYQVCWFDVRGFHCIEIVDAASAETAGRMSGGVVIAVAAR